MHAIGVMEPSERPKATAVTVRANVMSVLQKIVREEGGHLRVMVWRKGGGRVITAMKLPL